MDNTIQMIRSKLFELRDEKFREFQARLMPTVPKDVIIGVRTPLLRKLASEISKSGQAGEFLSHLPHKYYEENNIHGYIIAALPDFDTCVLELDRFLPYIDNWATCDTINPRTFGRHLSELMPHIRRWLSSDQTYTIRFGLNMLMSYYLDDAFSPEYLEMASKVKNGEYYVDMMEAWFFATALAKQYDSTIPYLEQRLLSGSVHSKTIQKAAESNRITDEKKEYLRLLRHRRNS